MRVDRLRNSDLVMLATDGGRDAPAHLGAVVLLEPGPIHGPDPDADPDPDLGALVRVIGDRLGAVPRLRQRLRTAPCGCGRPLWVDDPRFDPARHVTVRRCPDPGDRRALLDLATRICVRPLPREHPLWSAALITGLQDGRIGLVLQLHHVIADGIAGLGVLETLFDSPPVDGRRSAPTAYRPPPRPRPTARELAVEAWTSRWKALVRIPVRLTSTVSGLRAAGGLHPPPAAPCSLVRRTGHDRRIGVTTVDLTAVRAAAHADGVSVHDALLVAVTGTLQDVLAERGESVAAVRIAVMVSGATSAEIGNHAVPVVVSVNPTRTGAAQRQQVSRAVRAASTLVRADGRAAVSFAAALAVLLRIRPLRALYRVYLRRQRRFHTLVSMLRGPTEPGALGGHAVATVIPISTGEMGNTTVQFLALSSADELVITVMTDGQVTDLDHLSRHLRLRLTPAGEPNPA